MCNTGISCCRWAVAPWNTSQLRLGCGLGGVSWPDALHLVLDTGCFTVPFLNWWSLASIANDDRLRQCCVTFTHKTKFAHPSVQTWTGRLKCSCRGTWSGPELHKNTTLKGNLNWGYWYFYLFFFNLGTSLIASYVCILIIQVLTAVLQLYWGKNCSKAASWDGLQWTRCERCAVSISRHWWQSGRLHCACRSSTQGRGKKALTTKRNVKAPQKNRGSRGCN